MENSWRKTLNWALKKDRIWPGEKHGQVIGLVKDVWGVGRVHRVIGEGVAPEGYSNREGGATLNEF